MALMEGGKAMGQMLGPKEVVLVISSTEEASNMSKQTGDSNVPSPFEYGAYPFSDNLVVEPSKPRDSNVPSPFEYGAYSFSDNLRVETSNIELKDMVHLKPKIQVPSKTQSSSAEIAKLSPNPSNTPKTADGSVIQRRTIPRAAFGKPKSRLVEPTYVKSSNMVEKGTRAVPSSYRNSPKMASTPHKSNASTPKDYAKSGPITPKTPLMASPGREDDEDDQVYKIGNLQRYDEKKRGKKVKFVIIAEWVVFVCIMVLLVASLTIRHLRDIMPWGLEIWKWCVLVLVIFCGRLFTEWFVNVLVFLIERNFLLKKKVLYFLYGLKNSVRVFIWLGLILLAWALLINRGVRRSRQTTKILNHITRGLASTLIGAALWMVKTLLVKILASSFHVKTFFDRIQESIFHQYILRALSGPPVREYARKSGSSSRVSGQLSFRSPKQGSRKKEEEVIDVDKLHKVKREKVSAWTMGGLIRVITSSGLSTLSDALEDSVSHEDAEQEEITSELEAKAAAQKIFKNVAKPNNNYIDEMDLLRFVTLEEVDHMSPYCPQLVETGKIKKSALRNWVINVYHERKHLAHSLNDTKTGIEELNRIASGLVLVVIIIVWLLLMGIATTNVLVFIASQLLLVAFVFGNTAKDVFEGVVFVFVMHPFDVGDRCVIDGVQMVVEEMNILSTIFLKYDNEKIYYPNTVLATQAISNFNRSPEMGDSVEFAVDVSTPVKSIVYLKARIKAYLESKPKHWRPGHSVQINEIEDVSKMEMSLFVTHTINFQNAKKRSSRRSSLAFELKKIFEELGIKYSILPQEVHVTYVGSAAQARNRHFLHGDD